MRKKARKFNAAHNLANDPAVEVRVRRGRQPTSAGKRIRSRGRSVAHGTESAAAGEQTEDGDAEAAGAFDCLNILFSVTILTLCGRSCAVLPALNRSRARRQCQPSQRALEAKGSHWCLSFLPSYIYTL